MNKLPESPEAEAAVLGSILLDNAMLSVAKRWLTPETFYRPEHRMIYEAILSLEGGDIDLVILRDRLKVTKELQKVGGVDYLVAIEETVPSAVSCEYYAKIVRRHHVQRQIAIAGRETTEAAQNGSDVEDQLANAKHKLEAIELPQKGLSTIGEYVEPALIETEKGDYGVKTGFWQLDSLVGGLKPGNMIIVAGRPSMGKTALGLNVVAYAANQGHCVMVFSLEMTKIEVAQRLMYAEARQGKGGDVAKICRAAEAIKKWNVLIAEESMLTVDKMQSIAANSVHRPELIIIDYLQLMWEPAMKDSRYQQITLMSRKIKTAAQRLGVPIIVISQLNRAVEQRTNKRPMMSDLRDSGAIEQDADIVLLLYREKYYKPDTDINYAELIVGKNRNGDTGYIKLAWHPEYVRFDNYQSTKIGDCN